MCYLGGTIILLPKSTAEFLLYKSDCEAQLLWEGYSKRKLYMWINSDRKKKSLELVDPCSVFFHERGLSWTMDTSSPYSFLNRP